jgi:pectinesterase
VDFIFGAATAWFENCEIHSRQGGYLTAASTPREQDYGFVFHRCRLTGVEGHPYYLGRPWRAYAMTVFMDCEIDAQVRPEGWHPWAVKNPEKTVRYGEIRSFGAGSPGGERASWALWSEDTLSIETVLAGADGWVPVQH